jgi:hypothetical protein
MLQFFNLKNVFSTVYGEVKLISASSSIIIIHVPDIEVQAHLELIHKALTSGTNFWTNLEVYNISFSLYHFIIMCV